MATEPAIGTRIKRARERLRMTQAELAGRLGVSRGALNSWENNRAYPANSIGALEEVLGISLTEDDGPDPDPDDGDEQMVRQARELERQARMLLEAIERRSQRRQGGEPNAEVRRYGT